MNKLSNIGKVVVVAFAAVILIIILVIVYGSNSNNQNSMSSNGTASTTVTAGSPAETVNETATSTPTSGSTNGAVTTGINAKPSTVTPAPIVIHFITPVTGDIWKIGTQNVISWNQAGNFSGYIYLVDATTQNTVGVINPQTGPNQTSYTWSTINLSLSRTNPAAKNVTPGTYIIRISFDGNNLPVISSPAFTITN